MFTCVCVCVYLSYHTTHTTTAERRVEKQCRRRGASSGQKTKREIEGEDPAATGIERFFSLRGFWGDFFCLLQYGRAEEKHLFPVVLYN